MPLLASASGITFSGLPVSVTASQLIEEQGGGGGQSGGSPNISSASFANSFNTATQATEPKDLWFNSDGTKVFVADNSSNTIYRYGLSTGWDISTASYDSVSYSFSGTTTALNGLTFNADGTSFYIMGNDQGGTTPDSIFQFDMSPAYDIANASLAGSGNTGNGSNFAVDSTPQKLMFNNDGTKLYIVGGSDSIYQFSLSSAYDITTISYDSVSFSIATQTNNPRGMKFGHDGTKLYVLDSEGTSPVALDVYTMSSAYDISTLSYDSTVAINVSGIIRPEGLYLHPDGTSFYVQDGHATFATAAIYQYNTDAIGSGGGGDGVWYGDRGLASGGFTGNVAGVNNIDYWDMTTPGNASDFGDLINAVRIHGTGQSDGSRGLFLGGLSSSTFYNTISYVTTSTPSNATDFGDMTAANLGAGGVSDGTYSVAGGRSESDTYVNTIDYVTIQTTGNSTDFGDMVSAKVGYGPMSNSTYGLFAGGLITGNVPQDSIDYITIATPGNASDFGNLIQAQGFGPASASDATRGVLAGGQNGNGYTNVIQYVTIGTSGSGTDFGDLSAARDFSGGCGNGTVAHFTGGDPGNGSRTNEIQQITIQTLSNATNFGYISFENSQQANLSGSPS